MADLNFSNLADLAPTGTFVVVSGSVHIDISALLGRTVDSLTDEEVSDALFKLLSYANGAQTAYNVGKAAGERINSFPNITYGGTAIRQGALTTPATASVTVLMEAKLDNTLAVLS